MSSNVTTDHAAPSASPLPAKQAAVNALATVGFIALLVLGITLAIYSSRYVPIAISKLTGPTTPPSSLAVVPAATSPSNAGTLSATTTTTLTPPLAAVATAPATQSTPTNTAYPASNANTSATSHANAPYGLPDLSVTIIATGYLAGDATDSFVPANIIPPGARPAIKFSIANDGTNTTGPWNFLAQIPTMTGTVFNSPTEPSLNPGDHTVFTLGFNQAIPGPAQTMTVVADPNNTIFESDEGNNSAAAAVTITATGN